MGSYTQITYAGVPNVEQRGIGDLYIKPADFARAFTTYTPIHEEDSKVTRQYFFKAWKEDCYITVYDYKATNLYDDGLPSPDEFWQSPTYECLHVGIRWAYDKPQEFFDWNDLLYVDFIQWVYFYFNEVVLPREATA